MTSWSSTKKPSDRRRPGGRRKIRRHLSSSRGVRRQHGAMCHRLPAGALQTSPRDSSVRPGGRYRGYGVFRVDDVIRWWARGLGWGGGVAYPVRLVLETVVGESITVAIKLPAIYAGHAPYQQHALWVPVLDGHRILLHRRIQRRLVVPASTPVAAITSRTASKFRFSRSDAARLCRHTTTLSDETRCRSMQDRRQPSTAYRSAPPQRCRDPAQLLQHDRLRHHIRRHTRPAIRRWKQRHSASGASNVDPS